MTEKETELPDIDRTSMVVQDTVAKLIEAADVSNVYSRPVKQGDIAVITASENFTLMGFGVGTGSGGDPSEEGGYGTGGGVGGGRTLSRPVAIIVVTPEGAYVEPVADPTKVLLAAITAAGFAFGMMFRMARKR